MSFGENINQLIDCSENPHLQIHPSWVRVRLGDVAHILNGAPWKSQYFNSEDGVPVIRIRDVTSGTTDTRYNGPTGNGPWVETNDLLVGMDGDFNVRRWKSHRGLLNQRVCKLSISESLYSSRFVEYILPSYLAVINQATSSVTVKHLSSKTLNDLPVPLPPFAEQRRIVAKLDSLTARIARARAELKRVQVLKIHLRQQALRSCFADLEKHELPLGELLRGIEAGKNMRCVERPPVAGEKGVVKVSAVTWGHFDTTQTKTLPNDYLPPTKARIMKGDLLISRANTLELVGAAVIVEVQPDNIFLSDKILRLLVEEDKKSWILWYLRSPEGRSQIESLATGNQLSMRNISQAALRQIKIPLPTASIRQQRLARLTATIKAEVSLETEAQRVLTLLDRLESSLLAKAFRGELVPQNPNDEPASVLLDRIRTERAAAPKPGRKRKA